MNRVPLEVAEQRAKQIGEEIKKYVPEGWHFVLVLASPGKPGVPGRTTYIADIEKYGATRMLAELVLSMLNNQEI